jgi:hypothetical protein
MRTILIICSVVFVTCSIFYAVSHARSRPAIYKCFMVNTSGEHNLYRYDYTTHHYFPVLRNGNVVRCRPTE